VEARTVPSLVSFHLKISFFIVSDFIFAMLGIEPRALLVLDNHPNTEPFAFRLLCPLHRNLTLAEVTDR
jgi:hypothetical protein